MARPARRALMSAPSTARPRGLRGTAAALLLATFVALPFAVLYRAAVSRSLDDSWGWGWDSLPSVAASEEEEGAEADDVDSEDLKLERVLNKASMGDNTVILTTLNAAWFLTYGYLEMMWKRLDFLRLVLEKGYNFIFTDADIMWFRNPFPYFYPDVDIQIACDHYVGNESDLRNIANGSFSFVKSNEQTIEFYSFWYSARLRYPGYHDLLNVIKHDPYVSDIGLKIKFLSTAYFGRFCEPSRDLNKVCTMHANCCIGLWSKIHDLRIMMEDWRTYLSLPPNLKRMRAPAWRVPKNCSISSSDR